MSYPAAAVANQFLDRAKTSGRTLTQIEIQKLVYFAHGWHLGLKREPLIEETIEAWQYGPVVRRLYDAFKRFGGGAITQKAKDFRMDAYGELSSEEPSIVSPFPADDEYAVSLVGAVWQKYGTIAPFKLVELTHALGSPWEKAWRSGQRTIPNREIEQYFSALASPTA